MSWNNRDEDWKNESCLFKRPLGGLRLLWILKSLMTTKRLLVVSSRAIRLKHVFQAVLDILPLHLHVTPRYDMSLSWYIGTVWGGHCSLPILGQYFSTHVIWRRRQMQMSVQSFTKTSPFSYSLLVIESVHSYDTLHLKNGKYFGYISRLFLLLLFFYFFFFIIGVST